MYLHGRHLPVTPVHIFQSVAAAFCFGLCSQLGAIAGFSVPPVLLSEQGQAGVLRCAFLRWRAKFSFSHEEISNCSHPGKPIGKPKNSGVASLSPAVGGSSAPGPDRGGEFVRRAGPTIRPSCTGDRPARRSGPTQQNPAAFHQRYSSAALASRRCVHARHDHASRPSCGDDCAYSIAYRK